MEFASIISSGDKAAVEGFFKDKSKPPHYRAQALEVLFRGKRAPISGRDRAFLVSLLSDPDHEIRYMAAKIVGDVKEKYLVRQVLQLVVDDPDYTVRAQALIATRRWTMLTHLFFLEKALEDQNSKVRKEGIKSVGNLKVGALPPAVISRIEGISATDPAPEVRWAALDALMAWRRLTWDSISGLILDDNASEALRIHAIELSDNLPYAQKARLNALRDILLREQSIPLIWTAFQRVNVYLTDDPVVDDGLAELLKQTPLENSATVAIARHLKSRGYFVERKDGSWYVRRI